MAAVFRGSRKLWRRWRSHVDLALGNVPMYSSLNLCLLHIVTAVCMKTDVQGASYRCPALQVALVS